MVLSRRNFVQGSAAFGSALATTPSMARTLRSGVTNDLYPDPLYTKPFIDIDEWREEPVRHRYVHGGFADSELRFSMYFPPEENYRGRFFHPLMHIAGEENVAPKGRLGGLDGDSIPFAAASGGYLVESNQGTPNMHSVTPDIAGFRASAATAQYSRILAAEMYGAHRPYGYVFGGSGGAFKTFACAENTNGVWDGAVPFIHGSPVSLPNVFTVQAHALRVLEGKFDQIVDAIEPGGSGDMFAGLNTEQREALAEVTRMGMPPRAWFAHERIAYNYTGVFASIILPLFQLDPGYFADFWTKRGYLGDSPPQSLRDARIQHKTTITGVVTTDEARAKGLPVSIAAGTRGSAPAGIRLSSMPEGRLQGAFLFPRGGPADGKRLTIVGINGGLVMLGFGGDDIPALQQMKPGDAIEIDNSDYLAAQTYHRHQNPPEEYTVWDQFRASDGTPLYPQRPLFAGHDQAGKGNAYQSGVFDCKMISMNCLMDEAAYPWQADWYRKKVQGILGGRFENQYRIWYVDNALHVTPSRYLSPNEGHEPRKFHGPTDTRIVSYAGILQQALRDVSAWAEKGIAPPEETSYRAEDGQIFVPPAAAQRKGVQPVVSLTVNGGERADVAVGETVELVGKIEVPPGAGGVVSAEWDYDGSGAYPDAQTFNDDRARTTVRQSHAWDKPGTYFVALRAASQRREAVGTPFGKANNLGRVRIVVS
ncbi:MAG: hypothetical protein P8J20_12910 [Novosphingobium sp.]|nr:hypothetical protein [Novosphingobium sp.]